MKRVEAIINPYRLGDTKSALEQIGIEGMSVSPVHGFGQRTGHTELHGGSEHTAELHSKLKLEIIVADDLADQVTAALRSTAGSGKIGVARIFQLSVAKAVRVRTGGRSEPAVS